MSVYSQSNAILSRHPDMPMKALWEAIYDTSLAGPEVAMAIVNDPRCGIERRAEVKEGAMTNKASRYTLNWGAGGSTPLMLAALAGRNDVMEALLTLNAAVDAKEDTFGVTAIHISAAINNMYAIELLVAKGSDVKAVSKEGITPLHIAAESNKLEAIELLLAKGSDANAVGSDGDTPLHLAARNCHPEAIELLVAKGSDVKAVSKEGLTPLHFAVRSNKLKPIELLIAKGSDVNAVDNNGCTPLHLAARNCNTEAIELLVAKGSDVNAVIQSSKHTPLTEFENYTKFSGVSDEAKALVRAMLA